MFINLADFLRKSDILGKPYKAYVIYNNDPKKLGRIKCVIPGLLEEENPDKQIWIYQWNTTLLGGRGDMSSFAVPEIGTEVIVEFPYRDIYLGFYKGYWQSQATHTGFLDEDYPESYGFRDTQNTFLKINKAKKFFEFVHASQARFFIDKDSLIELRSKKGIRFISEDLQTELFFDLESGDVSFIPKNKLTIGGNNLEVKSDSVVENIGERITTIDGAQVIKVLGGNKLVVGGSDSKAVTGNQANIVAGNKSDMVVGTTDVTYGSVYKEVVVSGNKEIKLNAGDLKINIIIGNVNVETSSGGVVIKNPNGSIEIDASGNIKIDAQNAIEILAQAMAKVKGISGTELGDSSSSTKIKGSNVTIEGNQVNLGGAGGQPVARVGDQVMGIGNLGIPFIANIISGSSKVFSS